MATLSSRADLLDYCLRKLGSPLNEINVTPEQLDDIVDTSLSFFRDYYWDGIERMYLKHKITIDDVANKYITLPDNVFGVTRVFPTTGISSGDSNIFDLQYQLRMNDLRDLTSTSMIYYKQVMMHIDLIDQLLNTEKQFRWNCLTSKLYIDENWLYKEVVDQYILIDCYTALNPDDAPRYWNDRWLKLYVTAAIKKQWGQNIKKYSGITLPGGISLNGQDIYDEGKSELEEIEKEITNDQAPLSMMVG
jgi:hypothetical protein